MKKVLPFIVFCISISVFAQTTHDGLEFSRTEFNFPTTESWLSSVDTIEVSNITDKKILLLKQHYPQEFEVRFPASGIDPGKSAFIEIVYKPKEKGKFNTSLQIYHSASQTPVTITYRGEVLSFDEFADVACPSFSKPNLKPINFELEINVIDSVTRKPLGSSFIEITKGEFYEQHQADANGIFKQTATINYYIVLAAHAGYSDRAVAKHINPKVHRITIALPPLEKQKAITKNDSISVVQNEIPASLPLLEPASGFSLSEYKKNNIVFLIDKSSSMNLPDCMPLLQAAMTQLANMARPEDRITIITYSNDAKVVLPGTSGSEHEKIISVIQQLKCGGRTEGGKAIFTAYRNAEENFIKDGFNQVIIATDGGFNGLSDNEADLMHLIGMKAKSNIKLSVLAFGQNRFGKAMIARMAKQGEGFYQFISNAEDAQVKLTETVKLQSKIK